MPLRCAEKDSTSHETGRLPSMTFLCVQMAASSAFFDDYSVNGILLFNSFIQSYSSVLLVNPKSFARISAHSCDQ